MIFVPCSSTEYSKKTIVTINENNKPITQINGEYVGETLSINLFIWFESADAILLEINPWVALIIKFVVSSFVFFLTLAISFIALSSIGNLLYESKKLRAFFLLIYFFWPSLLLRNSISFINKSSNIVGLMNGIGGFEKA